MEIQKGMIEKPEMRINLVDEMNEEAEKEEQYMWF